MPTTVVEGIVTLEAQVGDLQKQLKNLKSQLSGITGKTKIKIPGAEVATKQIGKLGQLTGGLGQALSRLTPTLGAVGGQIGGVASSLAALGGPIGIAVVGITALGTGMAVLGKKSLDAAAEIETAMSEVASIVDTTAVNMDNLTSEVVKMTTEVGKGAVDLANGLYQTVSAGVDATEAIDFLRVAAKTATAGLSSTQVAVDGLTSIINSYGMQASEAGKLSDQLFKTVERGKTTFGELAGSIGRVAPLASQLNVKTEELFASISTLTATGLSTSESITALSSVLSAVIQPSEQAAKLAEQLGIQFNSAAIKSKGFATFVKEVTEATSGSEEALATLIGRKEGLLAMLTLGGKGAQKFASDLGAIRDSTGATERAFEKMTDTFNAQKELLGLTVKSIITQWGQKLLPAATSVVARINKALETLAVSHIDAIRKSSERLTSSLISQSSEVRETGNKLETLLSRYNELKNSLDSGTLSSKEARDAQQDLEAVISQIVQVVPQATNAFDKMGRVIGISTEAVEGFITAQTKMIASDVMKGIRRQSKEITNLQKELERTVSTLKRLKPGQTAFAKSPIWDPRVGEISFEELIISAAEMRGTLRALQADMQKVLQIPQVKEFRQEWIGLQDVIFASGNATKFVGQQSELLQKVVSAGFADNQKEAKKFLEMVAEIPNTFGELGELADEVADRITGGFVEVKKSLDDLAKEHKKAKESYADWLLTVGKTASASEKLTEFKARFEGIEGFLEKNKDAWRGYTRVVNSLEKEITREVKKNQKEIRDAHNKTVEAIKKADQKRIQSSKDAQEAVTKEIKRAQEAILRIIGQADVLREKQLNDEIAKYQKQIDEKKITITQGEKAIAFLQAEYAAERAKIAQKEAAEEIKIAKKKAAEQLKAISEHHTKWVKEQKAFADEVRKIDNQINSERVRRALDTANQIIKSETSSNEQIFDAIKTKMAIIKKSYAEQIAQVKKLGGTQEVVAKRISQLLQFQKEDLDDITTKIDDVTKDFGHMAEKIVSDFQTMTGEAENFQRAMRGEKKPSRVKTIRDGVSGGVVGDILDLSSVIGFEGELSAVRETLYEIGEIARNVFSKISDGFGVVVSILVDDLGTIKEEFSQMSSAISLGITDMFYKIADDGKNSMSELEFAVNGFTQAATGDYIGLVGTIKDYFGGLIDSIRGIDRELKKAIEGWEEVLTDTIGNVISRGVLSGLSMADIGSNIADFMRENVISQAASVMIADIPQIQNAIKAWATAIEEALDENSIAGIVISLKEQERIDAATKKIISSTTMAAKTLQDLSGRLFETPQNGEGTALKGVTEGIIKAVDRLKIIRDKMFEDGLRNQGKLLDIELNRIETARAAEESRIKDEIANNEEAGKRIAILNRTYSKLRLQTIADFVAKEKDIFTKSFESMETALSSIRGDALEHRLKQLDAALDSELDRIHEMYDTMGEEAEFSMDAMVLTSQNKLLAITNATGKSVSKRISLLNDLVLKEIELLDRSIKKEEERGKAKTKVWEAFHTFKESLLNKENKEIENFQSKILSDERQLQLDIMNLQGKTLEAKLQSIEWEKEARVKAITDTLGASEEANKLIEQINELYKNKAIFAEERITDAVRDEAQERIDIAQQEADEKAKILEQRAEDAKSWEEKIVQWEKDAHVASLRNTGKEFEAEKFLLDDWVKTQQRLIGEQLGTGSNAADSLEGVWEEFYRRLKSLEKEFGVKPGEILTAEAPVTRGIQLSRITGETRDLLVSLLSPIANLDQLPALFESLRTAMFEMRDAFLSSFIGGMQFVGLDRIAVALEKISSENGNGSVTNIDNIFIQVEQIADIGDIESLNRELGKTVLKDNRLTGRGIDGLGGVTA